MTSDKSLLSPEGLKLRSHLKISSRFLFFFVEILDEEPC